jgi:hypothetical protein
LDWFDEDLIVEIMEQYLQSIVAQGTEALHRSLDEAWHTLEAFMQPISAYIQEEFGLDRAILIPVGQLSLPQYFTASEAGFANPFTSHGACRSGRSRES